MAAQPPKEEFEEEDGVYERLDALEERLARLEEARRLSTIEDRVSDLEGGEQHEGDTDDSAREGEGQKALRLALAAFLNNENIAKATSELVTTLGSTINEGQA
jgi:hypothetical protein